MQCLKSSCDKLPTSLILILYDAEGEMVIGHSRISTLHKMADGCFVQSVVIDEKFRGKGWGRFIMLETEKYAKSKGKIVMYLSTSDKQEFYKKLGYTVCELVSIYGGTNLTRVKNNFISSIPSLNLFESIKSFFVPTLRIAPPPPTQPPKRVFMRKVVS